MSRQRHGRIVVAGCRRLGFLFASVAVMAAGPAPADPAATAASHYDLVIVGGTPAGITMAVRTAREGARVLLVNPTQHLGGMLASGLAVWNTRHDGARAPLYDDVRRAIFEHYRRRYGADSAQYRDAHPLPADYNIGKFEPRVAEKILTDLVAAEARITVLKSWHPIAAERDGARLRAITLREMDGTKTIRVTAEIFADCTYEADVLPLAGAPYRIGREARAEFGEPHAGVIFLGSVSEPPTPESARAARVSEALRLRKYPGFQTVLPGSTGEADTNVQAGNYRTILTDDPANRLPIAKPAGYDPVRMRQLEFKAEVRAVPNRKISLNRPQLLGAQNAYVEGDWTVRRRVMDEHWQATLALVWFHQNDPAVSAEERAHWSRYGLARDEFADNGHRPYEFYLREGRRLEGRARLTQHDVMLLPGLRVAPVHADGIAMIDWYVDSHAVTSRRVPGSSEEGKTMLFQESLPGQLPYRTLLPRGIDNLLVPVNVSATHVAFNTVRLEPVWMHLGEAAAYAAIQALRHGQTPAGIDCERLLRTLAEKRFMLAYFNDVDVSLGDPEVIAAQYFATKGFFARYDAHLGAPLGLGTARVWTSAWQRLMQGTLDPGAVLQETNAADERAGASASEQEFAALLPSSASRDALQSSNPITRGQSLRVLWDLVQRDPPPHPGAAALP